MVIILWLVGASRVVLRLRAIIDGLLDLEVTILIKSVQDMTNCVVVDVASLRNGHWLQIVNQVVVDDGNSVMVVNEFVSVALDFFWSNGILLQFEKFVLRWHVNDLSLVLAF